MNSTSQGSPERRGFSLTAGHLIRWTVVLLFIGRAWQHLFWDAPFRSLLWSEKDLGGLIEAMGLTWNDYATSPGVALGITWLIKATGAFYAVCAVAAWRLCQGSRWEKTCLWIGSAGLVLLAYLYHRDRLYRVGEFFEYACQFLAPVGLLLMNTRGVSPRVCEGVLRLGIVGCFVGHGLYAIGYYPMPGEWVTMTIHFLPINEVEATSLLHVAGILDMMVALGALVVNRPLNLVFMGYGALWGFLTAAARPLCFICPDSFLESAHFWMYEFAVRIPHFMVPLAVFAVVHGRVAWDSPLNIRCDGFISRFLFPSQRHHHKAIQ